MYLQHILYLVHLQHIQDLNASLQLCSTFLLCEQLSSSLLSTYYSIRKTIITLDPTFSEFVSFSTLWVSFSLGTLQLKEFWIGGGGNLNFRDSGLLETLCTEASFWLHYEALPKREFCLKHLSFCIGGTKLNSIVEKEICFYSYRLQSSRPGVLPKAMAIATDYCNCQNLMSLTD